MKHILHLFLLSLSAMFAVSCVDFDEEVGYNGIIKTPLCSELTDIASDGTYSVTISSKIGITQGRADITNYKIVISDNSYDCELQPDSTITCNIAGLTFGRQYNYQLSATINGAEAFLSSSHFSYDKSYARPQVTKVYFEMKKPGELTVCADYTTLKHFGLTSAVAKIGETRYDMTFGNGKAEFSIDMDKLSLNNIGKAYVTLTNKAAQVTYNTSDEFVFKKETTDYDNSNDKFLDDCIYTCGTYWAKGLITSKNQKGNYYDTKYYTYFLDKTDFRGIRGYSSMPKYFNSCTNTKEEHVNLQGTEDDLVTQMLGKQWGTPKSEQFQALIDNTSSQPVHVYDGTTRIGVGIIHYTRKDKKRFIGTTKIICQASNVYQLGVYLPRGYESKNKYSTSDYYSRKDVNKYRYIRKNILNDGKIASTREYLFSYGRTFDYDYEYLIPVKLAN